MLSYGCIKAIFDHLLQCGEDLDSVDHIDKPALIVAISRARDEDNWHSYMLDRGAQAEFATPNGTTALHGGAVCWVDRRDTATTQLQCGANAMAKGLPSEKEMLAEKSMESPF